MAMNDIIAKFIIKDNGTATLKNVGNQAQKTGIKMNTAAKKAGAGWSNVKGKIMAVAAAYVGFRSLIEGVKVIQEFETALVDMQKVTSRSLDLLREDIMKVPVEVGNARDLMKGYYQVISAGVTEPVLALKTLIIASKAAKASHVSQAEAIKGLTKVMAGFEGEIKSVTEASDLLFRIEREGQTSVAELIPVIGGLAKIAKEASISSTEMGAALSLLSQTAGSTSEASTRFRGTVVALIKPTQQLEAVYKEMGVSGFKASVEQIGFAESLKKVRETGIKMGFTMTEMFGRLEALIGQSALAANGFEDLALKEKNFTDISGATIKAFDEYKKTLLGLWETLKAKIEKVFIEMTTNTIPKLSIVLQTLIGWVDDVAGAFGVLWDILTAFPVSVIKHFQNMKKEMKETKDELDILTDPTPFDKFIQSAAIFSSDLGDIFIFTFKAIGNIIATFVSAALTTLGGLVNGISGISEMLIGAITGNAERRKAGWATWIKAGTDTLDGFGANMDAMFIGIATDFDDMTTKMQKKRDIDVKLDFGHKEIEDASKNVEKVKEEVKEIVSLSKELKSAWATVSEAMELDIAKIDTTAYEKSLIDIEIKADKMIDKFKDITGAGDDIKIWRDRMIEALDEVQAKKIMEIEIGQKIAEIDFARQARTISEGEAISQKLALNESLLLQAENELLIINSGTVAWFKQKEEIMKLRGEVLGLNNDLTVETGTAVEGMKEGFRSFFDGVGSEFEIMRDTTKEIFNGMQSQLTTVFGDAMRGELKSAADYWNSFKTVVINALADMIVKQLIFNSIKKAGEAAGGGFGSIVGALIGHKGGEVSDLPKYHSGGAIKKNERLIVGQEGEGIVSKKGMQNLAEINEGEGVGGLSQIINMKIDTMDSASFQSNMLKNKSAIAKAMMSASNFNNPVRRNRQ